MASRDALRRCGVPSPTEATVGSTSPPAAHASPVDAVPQPRSQNMDREHEPGNRRIVWTALTVEEINNAARKGFRPLVKAVRPGKDIHHMAAFFQDPETCEIELSGDVRSGLST